MHLVFHFRSSLDNSRRVLVIVDRFDTVQLQIGRTQWCSFSFLKKHKSTKYVLCLLLHSGQTELLPWLHTDTLAYGFNVKPI